MLTRSFRISGKEDLGEISSQWKDVVYFIPKRKKKNIARSRPTDKNEVKYER